MPFDGSGIFARVMDWTGDAAAAIKIRADRHDQNDDDIAGGLSQCITRSGLSQVTADIPWNGKKITNLGTPVADTDAVNKAYADLPKASATGLTISGADANGRLTFTSPTGANGLAWTGADLSWLARLATAAGPGTPPVPPATINRLVLNDKADGTGTDVIEVRDDGSVRAASFDTTGGALTAGDIKGGTLGAEFGIVYSGATAGGSMYFRPAGRDDPAHQLTIDGGGNVSTSQGMYATTFNSQYYQSTAANVILSAAGGTIFLRPNGTGSASGQTTIDATGTMSVDGIFITNMTVASATQNLILGANSGGVLLRPVHYGSASGQAVVTSNGDFQITGQGIKPGGGSWTATSDERIKTVSGPYTPGLAAVRQLNPVRYRYKGNDTGSEPIGAAAPYENSINYNAATTGTVYNGLIAQEVEAILPNMVSKTTAYIDGVQVNDLRMLDTSGLIYALINAVKELAAKVEALEAAP